MAQRGKPPFSLSLVKPTGPIETIPRPQPPYDLTGEESELWTTIVNRLPADWFPAETLPILTQYCRHTIQARRIAELIQAATADPTLQIGDYARLLRMQAAESQSIVTLATKLRCTPQSITNHRRNGRAAAGGHKPWQG